MYGSNWQGLPPRVLAGYTFDGRPYQITLSSDEPFGRGGSAVLHKGQLWDTDPLVVAVKIFHDHGAIPKDVREELLHRELRAARQVSMRHESILAFLGTAYDGRQEAIVSLYMKNGNLLEYLKEHRGCDKKRLILQVAGAVNYLHSVENLVHGDLKCANVLISDYEEALLADFGLSRFVDQVQSVCATVTGIRQMHTARFAAPELLVFGADPHAKPPSKTYETDVYAFGMLVLEAVTERLPWSDALPNDIAVVLQVHAGKHPPQPISPTGLLSISHAWWDVCKRCWSLDPVHRPRMPIVLDALTHTAVEPYRKLESHTGPVNSVAYLPYGHRVVCASIGGGIRIWDTLTGSPVIGPLRHRNRPVYSVAVSPDGRQICSGGGDHAIRRWDALSGAPIDNPLAGHDDEVHAVVFSPDGTRIISGSDDQTIRLWDTSTGQALGDPLFGHGHWVRSVAFSPDGTCIASGSHDGTIRLWDSATRAVLRVLRDDTSSNISPICFSPDRIHLVSGGNDREIRIWNVSTRQLARKINAHFDIITSVAVSPNGRYIVSGSRDNTIRIWDAQTGDVVGAPLRGHTNGINSVAFSPDGRSLVSGSVDGAVQICDLFE